MNEYFRKIAVAGCAVAMIAGCFVTPQVMQAIADEQVETVASTIDDLFGPGTVDSNRFRKYDVTLAPTVSTEVERTWSVKKIGHGRTSMVAIVRTPSGTYSTDGLLSPHVRYPGIETKPKQFGTDLGFLYAQRGPGYWAMVTKGSFIYLSYELSTRS